MGQQEESSRAQTTAPEPRLWIAPAFECIELKQAFSKPKEESFDGITDSS
jgi:hypothetical protein